MRTIRSCTVRAGCSRVSCACAALHFRGFSYAHMSDRYIGLRLYRRVL